MTAVTIDVSGLREMRGALVKLDKAQTKALAKVSRQMAVRANRRVKLLYRRVLHVRSGTLWRSVRIQRARDSRTRQAIFRVGTTVKYAKTHEDGATIFPSGRGRGIVRGRRVDGTLVTGTSQGRMLAIPVGRAKTRAGVARSMHIDSTANRLSGGQPFSTFVVGDAKKTLMLAVQGRAPEPIAALRPFVRIKRRPVFSRVARVVSRIFPREALRAIKRAGKRAGLQ